jgi:hypothetical protein
MQERAIWSRVNFFELANLSWPPDEFSERDSPAFDSETDGVRSITMVQRRHIKFTACHIDIGLSESGRNILIVQFKESRFSPTSMPTADQVRPVSEDTAFRAI